MKAKPLTFKERAHALIDQLPDYATWYDLITKAEEQYDIEGSLEFDRIVVVDEKSAAREP
jgi:hypothetical protein